jgi:hypothetical protein
MLTALTVLVWVIVGLIILGVVAYVATFVAILVQGFRAQRDLERQARFFRGVR